MPRGSSKEFKTFLLPTNPVSNDQEEVAIFLTDNISTEIHLFDTIYLTTDCFPWLGRQNARGNATVPA